MMIISCTGTDQDNVQNRNIVVKDSVPGKTGSASKQGLLNIIDTSSVSARNSIADISFYDSTNFVTSGKLDYYNKFPFLFIEKTRQIQAKEKSYLVEHLKPGNELPLQPLHADWIIGILLVVSFLFSVIRATSKSMLPDILRFFLFRGINDPVSRDTGRLYNWQSSILNLISFFIIALFFYCAASYYDLIPSGIGGFLFWLISLSIIILIATLRHVACVLTGNLSGEREIFKEYLYVIYLSYRFGSFFLLVLIIFMSYTNIMSVSLCIISGLIIAGIIYLISVSRLLIIFLNRNISIFYLILYLCALEILPVSIIIKYFSGVV